MTVGELKQALLLYRDNVQVVLEGPDGSLLPLRIERGRLYGREPSSFTSAARKGSAPFYKNAAIIKPA